jgi:hypothetical protein
MTAYSQGAEEQGLLQTLFLRSGFSWDSGKLIGWGRES